jgi:hypothetical protein
MSDVIKVTIGLVIFILATAMYVLQNCFSKEIVEFESFEVTNPTPTDVISDSKGKQLSTFSTEAMK